MPSSIPIILPQGRQDVRNRHRSRRGREEHEEQGCPAKSRKLLIIIGAVVLLAAPAAAEIFFKGGDARKTLRLPPRSSAGRI
jgi:hypothetical protein